MTSNSGKTSTVILVVLCIVLLSSSVVAVFYYYKESQLREEKEQALAQSQASEAKLKGELLDAKTKMNLLEEKMTEADDKINSLLDELDLEKGLREEMKTENSSLREAISAQAKEKEELQNQVSAAQAQVEELAKQLEAEQKARMAAEQKVEKIAQEQAPSSKPIELEKIVVAPEEIPAGQILRVNTDENFVIFSLGQADGMQKNMILSVYRGDNYLGDIKTIRVQARMSVGEPMGDFSIRKIRETDKVVVKE